MNEGKGNGGLQLQLDRIEAIQDRLRQVLMDETLDGFEALVAELGSRLRTALGTPEQPNPQAAGQRERIAAIGVNQRELAALAAGTIRSLGGRLKSAREGRRLTDGYGGRAARAAAQLRAGLDLIG